MLRVGLTGDLGSGKSTVAKLFQEQGAVVFASDEMGRALMVPGKPVFDEIVERFGPGILAADGTLNRRELARLAFDPENPRIEELNALVHPAVLAKQAKRIAQLRAERPHAIAVVESALIFSAKSGTGENWQDRFDVIVMVTAPDDTKVARFVERMATGRELSADERAALATDALARLAQQKANAAFAGQSLVIHNEGSMDELTQQANAVWEELILRERAL
ncbi:MAG: dephospho-CoA kinase [Acidobacteriaceae bacterium]|nr:dephospho-CoA kinase [Acidobacteriaceae bacterium]